MAGLRPGHLDKEDTAPLREMPAFSIGPKEK